MSFSKAVIYFVSGIGDNLALWRLKSEATKVSLSCLPQQGSQQTGKAKLLGWRISELPGSTVTCTMWGLNCQFSEMLDLSIGQLALQSFDRVELMLLTF